MYPLAPTQGPPPKPLPRIGPLHPRAVSPALFVFGRECDVHLGQTSRSVVSAKIHKQASSLELRTSLTSAIRNAGSGLTFANSIMAVIPKTMIPAAMVKRMILLVPKLLATSEDVGVSVGEGSDMGCHVKAEVVGGELGRGRNDIRVVRG